MEQMVILHPTLVQTFRKIILEHQHENEALVRPTILSSENRIEKRTMKKP